MLANQPVVVDKQKTAVVLHVEIPADNNIKKKENKKTEVQRSKRKTGTDVESKIKSGPKGN